MIPLMIGTLQNIPRTNYTIKEETGRFNVYYFTDFITEISIDNFLDLFKTTTFSKGTAISNLLLFIQKGNELKLINKNSKEHKDELKAFTKINKIKIGYKIEFISANQIFEGIF